MKWAVIFLLWVAFACQQQEEEVLDIHEVIPQSDYQENKEVEKQEEVFVPFNTTLSKEFGIEIDSLRLSSNALFLERFQPKQIRKIVLYHDLDSTAFYHLTFKDSLALKNAYFNALDCFGEHCITILPFQEVKVQRNAFYFFVGEKDMVWINRPKNKAQDWVLFLEKEIGVANWPIFLEQKRNGKLTWKQVVASKIITHESNK